MSRNPLRPTAAWTGWSTVWAIVLAFGLGAMFLVLALIGDTAQKVVGFLFAAVMAILGVILLRLLPAVRASAAEEAVRRVAEGRGDEPYPWVPLQGPGKLRTPAEWMGAGILLGAIAIGMVVAGILTVGDGGWLVLIPIAFGLAFGTGSALCWRVGLARYGWERTHGGGLGLKAASWWLAVFAVGGVYAVVRLRS